MLTDELLSRLFDNLKTGTESLPPRRERIATELLGAIIRTGHRGRDPWQQENTIEMARLAIRHADALIVEIDRGKTS